MRLGVVTTSYPREPGDAAGSFVGGMARWLARQGHSVEVVAAGPGAERDGPVSIVRVDGAGLFYDEGAPDRLERDPRAWLRAPLFTAALAAAAHRSARAWDAVCSHWLLPSGVVAASLGRGLPHLAVAHSGDVHLAARLAPVVAGVLRRARVVFVADHLRRRFGRPLGERSLVCPMGIEVAPRDRAAARARLGVDGRVVAFLGRLVPIKGLDVLREAVRRLPGTTLCVAGDGPLRRREPGFLGELRGEARDDLLFAADAVAVPSLELAGGRGEGSPTVVAEAFAAGTPVVASDVPGVREAAGGAARLVPPGDAAALAAALDETLAAGPEVAGRVARGREIAAQRSWDTIGARLCHFWFDVPTRGSL